jgi:hypothetical protein
MDKNQTIIKLVFITLEFSSTLIKNSLFHFYSYYNLLTRSDHYYFAMDGKSKVENVESFTSRRLSTHTLEHGSSIAS